MTNKAQRLENSLGSIQEMSSSIISDDELEAFPSEVNVLIDDQCFLEEIIPGSEGGNLEDLCSLLEVSRVLSRRNLTTAIAVGQTFLGSIPVWIAGTVEQKSRLAEILRSGGLNCLALTEELYGSDLQSNQVSIVATDNNEYRLNGEKWCINNATKGEAMSLFVRSNVGGGGKGFSMLFVDKAAIDPTTFTGIPKIKTHGLRGADISGIRYNNALIPQDFLLGKEGGGLNLALKTLQFSRTLCAGFSLGAADTSLRLTTQFALDRELYGAPAISIGSVRDKLAKSYRSILLAEAMAWIMTRACTLIPEQLSVYSAVVKYFVPKTMDDLIQQCSVVIGARGYIREGQYALFQKMKRDHAVVSLFDGSSEVNLYVICGQLRNQLKQKTNKKSYTIPWKALYDLSVDAPKFEGEGQKLSSRGNDFIWEGLFELLNETEEDLSSMLEFLASGHRQLTADMELLTDTVDQMDSSLFDLAKRYCELTAQALYVQFWHYNKSHFFSESMKDIAWLKNIISNKCSADMVQDNEVMMSLLVEQTQANKRYSHIGFDVDIRLP